MIWLNIIVSPKVFNAYFLVLYSGIFKPRVPRKATVCTRAWIGCPKSCPSRKIGLDRVDLCDDEKDEFVDLGMTETHELR